MSRHAIWVLRAPTLNESRNEVEFRMLADCIRRDERLGQGQQLLVLAAPGCLWAGDWLARQLGVEATPSPWAKDELSRISHMNSLCSDEDRPLVVFVTDKAAMGGTVLSPGSVTTILV